MYWTRKTACLALLISSFAAAPRSMAQTTSTRLSPIRQIRKGVDAWPLILNPKNDAERRVNVHITDLNSRLAHSLKECDSAYASSPVGREHLSADEEGTEFWTQAIKTTMAGPALLSLVANAGFYCGGAHPYGFTDAAVFDLKTGEPADPLRWFVPSIKASLEGEDSDYGPVEKSIHVPGLLQAYKDATHHQCDGAYSEDESFLVWPDAKSGRVMIQADRLPGCCEACGIVIGLSLNQARSLGFSEAFLQAIGDAHRQ